MTRLNRLDWPALTAAMDQVGCALTPRILTQKQCRDISALYNRDGLFRGTADMARFRYGSGQYRYFGAPLPATG